VRASCVWERVGEGEVDEGRGREGKREIEVKKGERERGKREREVKKERGGKSERSKEGERGKRERGRVRERERESSSFSTFPTPLPPPWSHVEQVHRNFYRQRHRFQSVCINNQSKTFRTHGKIKRSMEEWNKAYLG